VLRGTYTKINARYSKELSGFIDKCLIISPSMRPMVKDLLLHPNIRPHVTIDVAADKAQLLCTMKLPYGGLNQLKNILPKPKY